MGTGCRLGRPRDPGAGTYGIWLKHRQASDVGGAAALPVCLHGLTACDSAQPDVLLISTHIRSTEKRMWSFVSSTRVMLIPSVAILLLTNRSA